MSARAAGHGRRGTRPCSTTASTTASVQCRVCPRLCRIAPGKSGTCRARANRDGTLYAVTYGRVCSVAADPIEKKPLFHFFPGTTVLSLGTLGCNFTCRALPELADRPRRRRPRP